MSHASELHLAFRADQFALVEESLGIQVDLDQETLSPDTAVSEVNQALDEAFQRALSEAGFSLTEKQGACYIVETPKGSRRMIGFSLDLAYDPVEMGDSPEDATLGVPLSSGAYLPGLVGFEKESGGLHGIEMGGALTDIAQRHIKEAVPSFSKAHLIIVEKFF